MVMLALTRRLCVDFEFQSLQIWLVYVRAYSNNLSRVIDIMQIAYLMIKCVMCQLIRNNYLQAEKKITFCTH
jgi:hypothetical protein